MRFLPDAAERADAVPVVEPPNETGPHRGRHRDGLAARAEYPHERLEIGALSCDQDRKATREGGMEREGDLFRPCERRPTSLARRLAAACRRAVLLGRGDSRVHGEPQLRKAVPESRDDAVDGRLARIGFPGGEMRLVLVIGGGGRFDGLWHDERGVVPQQLLEHVTRGASRAQKLRATVESARRGAHAICRRASSWKRPFFFMSSSCVPLSRTIPFSR